jgi:nitrous oxide reductase accessory protein NosL
MTRRSLLSVVAVFIGLLSLGTAAFAQGGELTLDKTKRCEVSGVDWDKAADRVTVKVKASGKLRTHYFSGMVHARRFIEKRYGEEAELQAVQVLSYPSFTSDKPQMIDGRNAWYVFDFEQAVEGSQAEPHVAAYAEEKEARKAAKKLGGEVLDFDELWDELEGLE